ncbi:four helix bundle protein [Persicimonas caeni]|uniref:four helix bundle protein n=1 Tax=Persicimonas caeni TaxID=2292766 RepID=UPI00143DD6A9|nr:four helix bundle protein [Persicimonas caeni]
MIWKLAMTLCGLTYRITKQIPRDEMWGLQSQMRRAAVSIPSYIAEGAAKGTSRQLRKFLYDSRASLSELETQLKICDDIGFIHAKDIDSAYRVIDNLSPALQAFITSVEGQIKT